MMEKTHSCECHGHAVLIRALDNDIVADRSAGLCNILNAGLLRSLDIIAEGEECIASKRYAVDSIEICSLLCLCEGTDMQDIPFWAAHLLRLLSCSVLPL